MSSSGRILKEEICPRDGVRCIECSAPGIYTRHHCLPKAEYTELDRNQAWNIVNMCSPCQAKVHKSKVLLEKYRQIALARKPLGVISSGPQAAIKLMASKDVFSWMIERIVNIELMVATSGKPTAVQKKRAEEYASEMKNQFGLT